MSMIWKIFHSLVVLFAFSQVMLHASTVENDEGKEPWRKVLVIDGGGVRGTFPARVLERFEENHDQSISEIFKGGISGTSTGSIIALAVAARYHRDRGNEDSLMNAPPHLSGFKEGPYKPQEIAEQYIKMSFDVFSCCSTALCRENLEAKDTQCWENCVQNASPLGFFSHVFWTFLTCNGCCALNYNCMGYCGPKYSNHALKTQLEQWFGGMTLADTLVPVQIVAYDIEHNRPVYFDSINNPKMKMVDAALASSAAPTFFQAVRVDNGKNNVVCCVDGGLYDNNASFAAIRFALENLNKKIRRTENLKRIEDFVVVSIGTGEVTAPSYQLIRSGKIGWAQHAIKISTIGTTQAAAHNMRGMLNHNNGDLTIDNTRYFRIQVNIPRENSHMDHAPDARFIYNRADNTLNEGSGEYALYRRLYINEQPVTLMDEKGDS